MKKLMIVLAAVACLVSCSTEPKRMFIIGLDGLGSAYLDSLEIPVLRGLMADGTYTLHKRSVLPSSSAINWASIFNGLPSELHGYLRWNSESPDLPCPYVAENGRLPTVFSLMRAQKPESKIIGLYEWEGVKYCLDTLAFDEHRPTGSDNAVTTQAVIDCLVQEQPDLFYVHVDSPDHDGHSLGFGSPEYKAKIEELDGYLGQIFEALKEAGLYDDSIIVIVSDHGGNGKGHGKTSLQEMETPFILHGPGIRKGYEIPGLIMQYDVAATLAGILGLETPDFWRGRKIQL